MEILTGERILCITISDWNEPRRMRHHLMNILSENNDVIWVEKPISFAELKYTPISRYGKFLNPVEKVKPGLRIITPPPTIPFLDKTPFTDQINGWILIQWLKYTLSKINFIPTILWIFNTYAHQAIGMFGKQIAIYHCNDTCYAPRYVREERKLIAKADLVLTVSEQITEERLPYNPNCHTILHGVELSNFMQMDLPVPADLAKIPTPRISYVGVVRKQVDLDLLKEVARKRPDWSIVIVGPLQPGEFQNKEAFLEWQNVNLPNFYLLGGKSRSEIAAYYRWVDVALYPIVISPETLALQSASKFFEYLAMGRPIVSTNFATYKGIPPEFYEIAGNVDEFIEKIEKSLKENTPELQKRRREYAEQNSLEARLKEIAVLIEETRLRKNKEGNHN